MNRIILIISILGFWLLSLSQLSRRPRPVSIDHAESQATLLSSAVPSISKGVPPVATPENSTTPVPETVLAPEVEESEHVSTEKIPMRSEKGADGHVLLSGPFPED